MKASSVLCNCHVTQSLIFAVGSILGPTHSLWTELCSVLTAPLLFRLLSPTLQGGSQLAVYRLVQNSQNRGLKKKKKDPFKIKHLQQVLEDINSMVE